MMNSSRRSAPEVRSPSELHVSPRSVLLNSSLSPAYRVLASWGLMM